MSESVPAEVEEGAAVLLQPAGQLQRAAVESTGLHRTVVVEVVVVVG